ncbi:MAG TPA: alpha/beta hydrolase [Nitrospiria bacterium]|nr:alpha/beta hydrolase [Nitrospiria bacterium]
MPPDAPLSHRVITAEDGEAIHYYTGGVDDHHAPLLVFLHGLGSNHTRWQRLVREPFFRERCRLIVLDVRGHGASHARRFVDQNGIGRDVRTLLAQVNARRAILVGHCLGANLAVRVWEFCPDRVGGLVFIEPFVASSLRRDLMVIRVLLLPLFWLVYGMVRVADAVGLERTQFRFVDYEAYDEWVRSRLTSFWAAVRWMGPWVDLQTMPVSSYMQAFQTLFAYRPPWRAITCPTLAIYGKRAELAEDGGPPPSLDNPRIQTVHLDASHFVLTDNMPGVAATIEAFVRSQPPDAGSSPDG